MKKEHNSQVLQKKSLNMPFVIRWLIIIMSSLLVVLIWLSMIPFWIVVTLPTGRLMHEFDFIMQPYYWIAICYHNKRF